MRHPIDLIVVGTHGRTGVSRLLLGRVAERVMRGARCPVLVVPAPAGLGTPGPSGVAAAPEEAASRAPARSCVVCAKCRARIRGEALAHKQREERAGRS